MLQARFELELTARAPRLKPSLDYGFDKITLYDKSNAKIQTNPACINANTACA